MQKELTHEDLLSMIDYNQETGKMTWLVRRGRQAWPGSDAGTMGVYGYKQVGIYGKRHMFHRLAWFYITKEWPKNEIDHINGIRDDNRICNLREADRGENNRNCKIRKDNTTGVKGVSLKRGKYCARVRINGVRKWIGEFHTIEEAAKAVALVRDDLHQDFAKHK